MTDAERKVLQDAYYYARSERIKAEWEARKWLCEEQRIGHKLWREEPDGA
jgi:hypothetical protein